MSQFHLTLCSYSSMVHLQLNFSSKRRVSLVQKKGRPSCQLQLRYEANRWCNKGSRLSLVERIPPRILRGTLPEGSVRERAEVIKFRAVEGNRCEVRKHGCLPLPRRQDLPLFLLLFRLNSINIVWGWKSWLEFKLRARVSLIPA